MQRQQETIQQHLASLSEQDRQTFSQLSYIENYHYLAQHNLLEHDAESESELCFSDSETDSDTDSEDSESDSDDYLPDLCDPNAKSEKDDWNSFSSGLDTKSVPLDAKVVCARPKAANGANEVCNNFNIHF